MNKQDEERLTVERIQTSISQNRTPHEEHDPLLRFLTGVYHEVRRARAKFPDPSCSMVALGEEAGELAKALLDEPSDRVVAEAIQVACMAARVAIEGDPTLDPYRSKSGAGSHPNSTANQRRRSASVDTGRPSERGSFSHSRDCPDANGGAASAVESPGLPVSSVGGRSISGVKS